MKAASTALQTLFATGLQIPFFDCFTFTLIDGTILRVTDCDRPVFLRGVFFRADHMQVKGMKYKATTGLEVDTQEVDIIAWPKDTINGVGVIHAIEGKVFDGATVRRERAYFDPAVWPPAPGQPAIALDSDLRFLGFVADVTGVSRISAQINVKSFIAKLDQDFPRNFYQPTCQHTLFDSGCGLTRALYIRQGAVGASPSAIFLPCSLGGSGAAAHAVMSSSAGATIARVVLLSASSVNRTYLAEPTITLTDATGSGAVLKAVGVLSAPQEGSVTGSRFYFYGIIVVSPGAGYTNPTVVITPAGGDPGTGAMAQAILGAGSATVSSIVIDAGGASYSPKTQFLLTGGGGSGASFSPVLTGGVVTGATSVSGGTLYSSAPSVQVIDSASLAYAHGTVYFETGANAGQYRQVKSATAGGITLAYPLDTIPTAGDQFAIWPGCDHTQGPGGCAGFNNANNFRAYPFVPPAQTAY